MLKIENKLTLAYEVINIAIEMLDTHIEPGKQLSQTVLWVISLRH